VSYGADRTVLSAGFIVKNQALLLRRNRVLFDFVSSKQNTRSSKNKKKGKLKLKFLLAGEK